MLNIKNEYLTLLVKPTHRCNMNCSYCYDKIYRDNIGRSMSLSDIKDIALRAAPASKYINWIWHGGEALLMGKEWLDLAFNTVKSVLGGRVFFSLQTNSLLIDEEWIALFKKHECNIGISFDGIHHDEMRAPNSEIVKRNIKLCIDNDLRPGVISVLTQETICDWKANLDLFKSLGLESASFNIVHAKDLSGSDDHILNKDIYIKKLIEFYDYVLKSDIGFYDRNLEAVFANILGYSECVCNFSDCTGRFLCVTPEMYVYPCDRYYPEKYKLGDLQDFESLREAFYTKGYELVIQERLERTNYCKENCEASAFCKGGCNATALLYNNGNFKKPDETSCETYKAILAYAISELDKLKTEDDLIKINTQYANFIRKHKFNKEEEVCELK